VSFMCSPQNFICVLPAMEPVYVQVVGYEEKQYLQPNWPSGNLGQAMPCRGILDRRNDVIEDKNLQ